MESIDKELTVLENQISRFEAEMTPEHEKLMKIQHDYRHYVASHEKYKTRYEEAKEKRDTTRALLDKQIIKCQEHHARVPVTHSFEEITESLRVLTSRLREQERELGSREAIFQELSKKRQIYNLASLEIEQGREFLTVFTHAQHKRRVKLHEFKTLTTENAQRMFSSLLQKRNFRGCLEVDHDARKLSLNVDIENAEARDQVKKSTNSLSGGIHD